MVDGRRSTSATGRAVVADAVRDLDPALAEVVGSDPDWRHGYLRAVRRMTELEARSGDAALAIAGAGLDAVHRRFRVRQDGEDLSLDQVMRRDPEGSARPPAVHPVAVAGAGEPGPCGLEIPYRGGLLAGDDLARRLDTWLADGIAEPSLAEAITAVAEHPEWLDLRDLTVVVLGAGAELGPLPSLVRWGAHVVAVDLPGFARWRRLIDVVRASPGRMTLPVSRWLPATATDDELAAAAGNDLLTAVPDLLAWLSSLDGPLTLGSYAYADGADNVRLAVAVDALAGALTAARDDVSLAYLATPTDVFAVPAEVVVDSRRRYASRVTTWHRLARLGTGGHLFAPNYSGRPGQRGLVRTADGRPLGILDALVSQQGPNYTLAKRIQRWRALRARADGVRVSINVAPATRTRSVLRNRALAAAYAGAHRFGIEIFDPPAANTLMAALLVHDLRNPEAAAAPETPLSTPVELFWRGALHGGLWRGGFAPRSVLGTAVVLGMVRRGA
ncbi:MAG: hypothetical protein GXX79_10995 [Actinomycetales bacterium]|nr:hypothetical protein [Actinomycetales bacterium]